MNERKDEGQHVYNIRRLHALLLVGSILLLASLYFIVREEYGRPWRTYQRRFHAVETRKTVEDIKNELTRIDANLAALQRERQAATQPERQSALDARIDALSASRKAEALRALKLVPSNGQKVANAIRNLPLIDFISPTEKIEQNTTREIYDAFSAVDVPRSDRCITCHVAIDQQGYERLPNPFKTHPRLAEYVGSSSPHPIDKFGCTVCHGGNGRATDFSRAGHQPASPEQRSKWAATGRKPDTQLNEPILPLTYTEANCSICHRSSFEVPAAHQLNTGRIQFERDGCSGCHKVNQLDGAPNNRKQGFDLRFLADKLDRDWVLKWLQDPRVFRPDTRMPRVFHLENMSDAESTAREDVAIRAIAQYLFAESAPLVFETTATAMSTTAGEQIIRTQGCAACHTLPSLGLTSNGQGPNLSAVGAKTSQRWLGNWILNPQRAFPDTLMPNIRATESEAADVGLFLSGLQGDAATSAAFAAVPIPTASDAALKAMFADFVNTPDRKNVNYDALSEEQRLKLLGEQMISWYGCAGCHQIKGFENAVRNGAELSREGAKRVEDFDFGVLESPTGVDYALTSGSATMNPPPKINPARHSWLAAKTVRPRVFDYQRKVRFTDRLRMPQYDFTTSQATGVVGYTLGLKQGRVSPALANTSTPPRQLQGTGRAVATKYNCTGCHQMGVFPSEVPLEGTPFDSKLLWARNDESVTLPTGIGETTSIKVLSRNDFVRGDRVLTPGGAPKSVVATLVKAGRTSVDVYGNNEGDLLRQYSVAAFGPPLLRLEGRKILYQWLLDYLHCPYMLRPQVEIRMPTFPWRDGEAQAMVGFFALSADEPWPLYVEETTQTREQIAAGKAIFGTRGTPGYTSSMQCNQCHPTGKILPPNEKSQWGPNLALGQYRLKSRWIYSWMFNPQYYIPGTFMPSLFYDTATDPPRQIVANPDQKMWDIVAFTKHMDVPLDELRYARSEDLETTATQTDTSPTQAASITR